MRVSSLSDERVIGLVTNYFVPVWVSCDDYQRAPHTAAEEAERTRINRECRRLGFRGGNVCVYLLGADGALLATLPVQQASNPDNLVPLLEKIVGQTRPARRRAEDIRATAAPPAEARPKTEGGRLVHVWTRCDQPGPNRGVTNDLVELTAAEGRAFLPPAGAEPGSAWDVPDDVAAKLFRYAYPPRPFWDARDSKVLQASLRATLVTVTEREARVRLEGSVRLSFPHTGKPTDGRVTARFVGVAVYDRKKPGLASLALVSEQAEYVWYWEGKPQPIRMRVALETEP